MFCLYVSILLCLVQISLSCKTNDNQPVDWWYMYKPPTNVASFVDSNVFIYFTSETANEFRGWTASNKFLKTSMLQNTLTPLYDVKYHDDYAIYIYDESTKRNQSNARGILMTNHEGGVWIIHTAPDLPDLTNPRAFPVKEFSNGHLIACFSLDITAVNDVAALIRQAHPAVRYISIPHARKSQLPMWDYKSVFTKGNSLKFLKVATKAGTMDLFSIVRGPRSNLCLYEAFAKNKNIVLDVYGRTDKPFMSSTCARNYSVRNIEGLSIKVLDKIFYVHSQNDYSRFAVSTAAHWQKTGASGPNVYWACISSLDKENTKPLASIITCVNHFDVWRSFDLLKIKEPEC